MDVVSDSSLILQNCEKIPLYQNVKIDFDRLPYHYQFKEEVSSGGDHLTSNRIGAYTKKEGGGILIFPLLFLVSHIAKKNSKKSDIKVGIQDSTYPLQVLMARDRMQSR